MSPIAKPPAELAMANGLRLEILGGDCSQEQIARFISGFRTVWDRLPEVTRIVLDRHTNGKLSVILTKAAPGWGGFSQGFASTKPDGKAIYFWAPVLERIPEETLRTDIAHELGHATFIALGEPGHRRVGYPKAEWLIIALLQVWGYNQPASDEWKGRHLEIDADGPRWRDPPISDADYTQTREDDQEMLIRMAANVSAYCNERKSYFEIVAGNCSPEIAEIARTAPERLGRILSGEEPEPTRTQ